MNTETNSIELSRTVLNEAADWVLRIEESPEILTTEAFEAWLYASAAHRSAFAMMSNTWGATAGVMASQKAPRSDQRARGFQFQSLMSRPAAWMSMAGVFMACAAALVFSADLGTEAVQWQAAYSTDTAEIKNVQLADGTELFLDARSTADAAFTEHSRVLTLQSGRLFVDVQRDESKPFVVELNDETEFTALGTAYAVERLNDGWRLEVYEGQVRVDGLSRPLVLTADEGAQFTSNQLARFDMKNTLVVEQPNWASERIVFDGETLEEALIAFARYSDDTISVDGARLKSFRISGTFKLTEPDAFVETVSQLTGARAIREGSKIRLRQDG
ncbi:FecR family protein [Ponticaulis profundi]|uniref:FecR family protein n=1 Tax=Ponticaulis profundi TaxID=2665222 RepID=A0ABW1SCY8_9PROT